MAVSEEVLEHALDLFRDLGRIGTGRMFSGVALYVEEDVMFAMISSSDVIYMKTDPQVQGQFEAAGSEPFWYTRGGDRKQVTSLMSLPDSAMDDPEDAVIWARLSLGPARAAAEKKRAEKARKAARKARQAG
ncbi:TfoX/Sxy family protein [Pseudooceanicola sp. C21-150M6]|uniref:TfoX/Sxy family protein n=1 Tax=Pseudooceanicola sp. C21-150M6 TaxID=3434355 RepID=UPI003D7FACF4